MINGDFPSVIFCMFTKGYLENSSHEQSTSSSCSSSPSASPCLTGVGEDAQVLIQAEVEDVSMDINHINIVIQGLGVGKWPDLSHHPRIGEF